MEKRFTANHELAKRRSYQESVKQGNKTGSFTYTEIHVEVWVLSILLGVAAISIIFFVVPDMNIRTALFLVYLHAMILFILSNGILINPVQLIYASR